MAKLTQKQRKLYESIVSDLAKVVKTRVNEEFVAPEKTLKEKLFGQSAAYAARVKAAEDEYYKEHAKPLLDKLTKASSLQDLLVISRMMLAEGFKYPVSGMIVGGVTPARAELKDISWQTYDLDSTFRANVLASIEKKSAVNDVVVYTYYYSWKWWVANIVRCLVFWRDPYGSEASEGIKEQLKYYSPKCPVIDLYPEYFKQ